MAEIIMTNRLANDLDNILARTEPLWSDLRGERILIACGTRPAHNADIPFDGRRVLNSDQITGGFRVKMLSTPC